MKRLMLIIFSASVILSGCITSKPMVSLEKGVSLSRYQAVEIASVRDETGKIYGFNVAASLTRNIKASFQQKGYVLSDGKQTSQEVLLIKCRLLSFEPGSAFKRWLVPGFGKTQATVQTSLIDKKSGKLLGELVSAEAVSTGGLYSAGADVRILEAIAEGIVNEIEKKGIGH